MESNSGFGKKSVNKVVMCMWLLLVLWSCEATISTTGDDGGRSIQKLEVQKLLKSLNKPAVKSIKSVDGDIIDCVNILHQPAFDHPGLKNHKIQMRPNLYPEGSTFEVRNISSKSKTLEQLWHKNGRCPEGTIPIRRTKKDDILRANSIQKFGKKEQRSFPQLKFFQPPANIYNLSSGHEHAVAYVTGDKYYGACATINVWNPNVQQSNEFSLSQIWVLAGSFENKNLNSIEAGWMVNPNLYGDNHTRLFTYWTMDAYSSTGCYDIRCSGFIQISSNITLGGTIQPDSQYGSSQYQIDILIWKDPKSGNWWLRYGNYNVGYWPASLFSYLKDSATLIEWGGEVVNTNFDGQHTSTQMGSGHFPNEGYGKASYFIQVQTIDGNNKASYPTNLGISNLNEKCYSITTGSSSHWGSYFFFGGPGRNPNCP